MKAAPGRRVRLIVWNEAEAARRAESLTAAGWKVERSLPPGPALLRELRGAPPDAVVVDLGRLPSQGRDVALSIRTAAATRSVPLVFIEGDPVKTAKVKTLLPDAIYASWKDVRGALRRAIAARPAQPLPAPGVFAGYSGTPLPRKLGVKPGMIVALVSAPGDFAAALGPLAEGAVLRSGTRQTAGLTIWFVRTSAELSRDIEKMADFIGSSRLWIAWRKKTALGPAAGTDTPSEPSVRSAGLAVGLVDFKICAINETWSGLLFTRRRR